MPSQTALIIEDVGLQSRVGREHGVQYGANSISGRILHGTGHVSLKVGGERHSRHSQSPGSALMPCRGSEEFGWRLFNRMGECTCRPLHCQARASDSHISRLPPSVDDIACDPRYDRRIMDITFDRGGAVAIVTLDRPQALHALTLEMAGRLDRQLAEWAGDTTVRAVVIRSAGGR